MNDLELLRRYEPVVRYTHGELFYPAAVEGYLGFCSLRMADSRRHTTVVAGSGQVTPSVLGQHRNVPLNHRYYLQYVDEPLPPLEYRRWSARPDRPRLHGANRLQRVGLVARILDGLFDISLLVRGRVPGGTAAAADVRYRATVAVDPRRVYYGRVLRSAGYVVLHYMFFYHMNDWRSTFHGVNDHESDWEQIFVYLVQREDGGLEPRWAAYASHDFSGDDLRRRWDDDELQLTNGTHPVIYAGAGSHASYYTQGEYLVETEPGFVAPLRGAAAAFERFWTDTLRQSGQLNLDAWVRNLLTIPFVDYARGDGVSIGPGQPEAWTPIIISDEVDWVDGYRGLWGLDTWDPLGGERAPSGPKYNRDGSVRQSWSDPLGWAGLDKVPPPGEAVPKMEQLLVDLERQQRELAVKIDEQRAGLRKLELETSALRTTQYLEKLAQDRRQELARTEAELQKLVERQANLAETSKAAATQLEHLRQGDFGPARAHIRRAHAPRPSVDSHGRFTLLWAAISGGLLLLSIVALIVYHPPHWPYWIVAVGVVFGAIESATRGRFAGYLLACAIVLAIATAIILLYVFWWLAITLALTALVILMIRDNLREVFGG